MNQLVEIHGVSGDGLDDLRATIDLVSVHVDLAEHRPIPLPHWVKDVFAAFDAHADAHVSAIEPAAG